MPTLVPAVSRTMAVFEVFAHEKRELSNSDMARHLEVAESSASDLLHSLHSLGYLMRTPRTRRFYPTGRLYETARQITKNDPLTTVAQEAVEQLTEKTNEGGFFGVLDHSSVKVVAAQPSRLPLRYVMDVGQRVSFHASALGKALLGMLSREDALRRLERHGLRQLTPNTITSVKQLMSQIEAGRAVGWYEAHGEGTEGVSALAVSGWLGGQRVAISLAGPSERIEKNRDAYLKALRAVRGALLADD